MKRIWIIILLIFIFAAAAWFFVPEKKIDFNTQVKPIINRNCISCHGGVRRKAGFSLLFRQEAIAPTESGKPALVPGHPEQSEFISRLSMSDPEDRMPYRHEALTAKEIEILTKWVKEGAVWGDHWAYVPVKAQTAPETSGVIASWVKNDIDRFVSAKWTEKNLKFSAETDKPTLLRRVSLDLIGVPAPPNIAHQYLTDESPDAYGNLVDALLASPHYGERWTSLWLDLARYADTKGYERDDSRSIWRYRDWLIRAFNDDKPYDQFITEQLAGDLMPSPTDQQLIATAFHRNSMTNDEGGTDNEEFRTAAILDRVNTTWEVLLGTTFACTQCHSHPYDPFRNEEYYKFMAFFNNTRDEDTYAEYPLLRTYNPADSIKLQKLKAWMVSNVSARKSDEVNYFLKTWQPAINSLTADQFVNSELSDTKWLLLRNHASSRLRHVDLSGKNQIIFRYATWSATGSWRIHLDAPGGPVIATISHTDTKGSWKLDQHAILTNAGAHDLYLTYENPALKNANDSGIKFDWFYFTEKIKTDSAQARFWSLLNADVTTTPIMLDNPTSMKRETNVFERGSWLMKGKQVEPGTPGSLLAFPPAAPRNRLGLAQWMTDPGNPLTSRTIVNRIWEQLFGAGLVETLEDMGTQGATPTHPELLDHIAMKLMTTDHWRIKSLLKYIVMSATYRQESRSTEELIEKDPYNKYFARGPRVRLSAEQVRDQSLAVAGLLSEKMYGESVMPWQPQGIWQSPYNGQEWKISNGEDAHRRAIYTYWKRTSPYPSMLMFDGSSREVCSARRIRTNTPLQALVSLNDSTYIEAAHALAMRMKTTGNTIQSQISSGYEIAMGQPISQKKLDVLVKLYDRSAQTKRKAAYIKNTSADAALDIVAGVILNLDEFITKN